MARNLLEESSSDSDTGTDSHTQGDFKINDEFARRFEHNKKREELQKLEEKHGNASRKRKRDKENSELPSSDESSSESEEEDDAGELATTALDSEIMATLHAIRSKDPRVYDGKSTFYNTIPDDGHQHKEKKTKPVYLRDYHRENLLNGIQPAEDEPLSYAQEQHQLKDEIVKAMHTLVESDDDDNDSDGEGLLVAKKHDRPVPQVGLDIENAEKDPETFLSNFMSSRAWVPTERTVYQPLESDDEDDERMAEEYEEAYNLRFEDPAKFNEKLRTHARDMAAKYSVRREETTSRQKKREALKEVKELEKQQLKQERTRLKKLRIENIEEKVGKIKQAAGLKTSDLQPEDWARFVDDEWDDDRWETEMQRRFGDNYYAERDVVSDEEEGTQRKKPKKPRFDDDLDINDIVPDFDADNKAKFNSSDDDDDHAVATVKNKKRKDAKEDKIEMRKERRIIEQLVDDQLQYDLDHSLNSKSGTSSFRYRQTTPEAFGLSSTDILLADDTQLNQFAGLKKLASFRDADKKLKDKKHLGKKARLRKWRQETFGNEEGVLEDDFARPPASQVDEVPNGDVSNIRTHGKKKRHRGKKQKIDA